MPPGPPGPLAPTGPAGPMSPTAPTGPWVAVTPIGRDCRAARRRRRPLTSSQSATSRSSTPPAAIPPSTSSFSRPRGGTGNAGTPSSPWPKSPDAAAFPARVCPAGSCFAICPASVSAAAASTVPKPTWSSYPPFGGFALDPVIALLTCAAVSFGYLALISAATPAVSAQAGLVPLTTQYLLPLPWAGTFTPGAATWTDRFSLEKYAGLPDCVTAATPITPG